ncbi:MAG: ATP-binding protein [Candidatus Asgardarchaeia archaeon]
MIMLRKFVNRKEEIMHLEGEYGAPRFSFTVIYGRRRVGKTELILQLAKKHPHIYFLADKRGTISNVIRFRKKAAAYFGDTEPAAESFDTVFEYIAKRWTKSEKLIIVIDEFSYLVEKDDAIPSVFQLIIDEILSKRNNVYLILAGSLISMIEKGVLSYKSPLYGRRTSQIKLNPLKFRDLFEFFPEYSAEEIVRIYGAVGGIPYYLNMINPQLDFFENVNRIFLNKESVLFYEGEWLLREELRDPSNYLNILSAIARGSTRISEIANKTYIPAKDLPYYLQTLQKLGFVRREVPILEKPTTKKSIYILSDNFLRFWFRYIFSNLENIESGDTESVLEEIKSSYNTFLGKTFEDICIEFVKGLSRHNLLPIKIKKIGRQWGTIRGKRKGYNRYEIDFIGIDASRKKILVGESKWRDNVNCEKTLDELKEKVNCVPGKEKFEEIHFCIIAKSFSKKVTQEKNVLCFELKDIAKKQIE